MKILFVCLGNICRSPIAEGIAKDIIKQNSLNIHIDSAGTSSWHIGEMPCSNSIRVANLNGVDISHFRARQVTKNDLKEFDFIVGLDKSNIEDLRSIGCENPLLLGDFGFDGNDVPDPYFFDGFDGFDKVYNMIKICTDNLIKHIISKY
ncbi:MAG: low molecular weight phosphotyrosine protein phosphatase [Sulfurovaceae bacterium]|nr:low molecular weight phosphotyrosine protein phosphatase [Sulfurovaceae bacterium]MDD5548104.1 low molecular weight phosphotyrosine protein phosphatase [Sulfurovaceae bacterium]